MSEKQREKPVRKIFNTVQYGVNVRIMRDENNEEWINAFEYEHALMVKNAMHEPHTTH